MFNDTDLIDSAYEAGPVDALRNEPFELDTDDHVPRYTFRDRLPVIVHASRNVAEAVSPVSLSVPLSGRPANVKMRPDMSMCVGTTDWEDWSGDRSQIECF